MSRPSPRRLAVAVATASLVVGFGLPAQAQPLAHFVDEGPYSFVIDCGDFDLQVDGTFREHILVNGRGRDRVPHFHANVRFEETITHLDTGRSLSASGRFLDKDQTVTDNEDGTFTVIIKLAGMVRHDDPDGRLMFLDTGNIWLQNLYSDDGVFPSDGDSFLSSEELRSAGREDTKDRDFCADMAELLG